MMSKFFALFDEQDSILDFVFFLHVIIWHVWNPSPHYIPLLLTNC